MVDGLARDSTTPIGRVVGGPWDDTEHLLRVLAAEVAALRADYENVHRKQGSEPRTPPDIPTPPATRYQRKAAKQGRPQDQHARRSEAGLLAVLNQEG